MKLEKKKLNDGSYDYFYGYDRVEIADELTETKTPVYVYSDYYQFRNRPTKSRLSLIKLTDYKRSDGDLTLEKTIVMWKEKNNIFVAKN